MKYSTTKKFRKLEWESFSLLLACHTYQPIRAKLGLMTLKKRRIISDLLFIYKLLYDNIDYSGILQHIKFYAPIRNIRRTSLFYIEPHRIATHVNNYSSRMELFGLLF